MRVLLRKLTKKLIKCLYQTNIVHIVIARYLVELIMNFVSGNENLLLKEV